MNNVRWRTKRLFIGLFGGLMLFVGVIAIPYPGPGWLIVFAALGILATEFDWAQQLLEYAKDKYDKWQDWLQRQSKLIKSIFWLSTAAVAVATIYLLNGYGLINSLLHLNQDWLVSPLFK